MHRCGTDLRLLVYRMDTTYGSKQLHLKVKRNKIRCCSLSIPLSCGKHSRCL